MVRSKTWLIFGCSPFINEIADKIPRLCEKYSSIGLNLLPTAYPCVEHWIFTDHGIFSRCYKSGYIKKHHKLIVHKDRLSELKTVWFRENQCQIQREFLMEPHYVFEPVTSLPVVIESGKLLFLYSVVLPAINYAILQGAQEIILIGIDLNHDWQHFYGNATKKDFDQIEVIQQKIALFKPYVKIYKANKEANIDLEWLNVDSL